MRYRKTGLMILCLALAMCLLAPMAAHAREKEEKVVRVGWYESAFHHTDEFGRKSGYGYEYQQRVAIFTGWKYEYVEGSWSELLEKLIAGEIDLLSDVSFTEEREQKILYSAEEMGSEDYYTFITPENTEIRPDDFSTFNGRRVGVNRNSIQEKLFVEWADSHDVEPEVIELSGKTPELMEMLAKGEIDVLVTLDTYANSYDIVPVCKIGSASSYFGINKNRPDLKMDLDVAMNRLKEANRDFNQQMTERYHKSGAVNSYLITEEKNWLNGHGAIRVGYRDNNLPFCAAGTDGGVIGLLADYLLFAETSEKNAQIHVETRAFRTTEEALQAMEKGEIDCVFPLSMSAYDGEQRGIIISDPVISTEMYATVRTADRMGISPEREMRVAVIKGNPNYESFLMDHFPKWQVQYYSDGTDAFLAVAGGVADCGLASSYRVSHISDELAEYRLSALSTGENMDMSFAMRKEDDCLYSILNKVSRLMPQTLKNASLTANSFQEERTTFRKFLKDNLASVITGISVLVILVLSLILWNVRSTMKANEGRQLISEAENDPLTGLHNRNFLIIYVNRDHREHPDRAMDAVAINIECFHTLNGLHGRDFGDRVLKALGEEIAAFTRETGGFAGRVSADHFDIWCPHREEYVSVLKRFQSRMNEFSGEADVRLRMGVMPWQEGAEPEWMFSRAWSACSLARGDYKTRLMVYDDKLRQQDERNQRLLNDFSRALEKKELAVYYQPKYAVQGEKPELNSAEALVRWRHPELGMIPPDQFIPLFEKSGQISALDNYVWTEAARQTAAWRNQFGKTLPVSVNLSRVDVFDPNLVTILDGIVEKNGLNRADLQLEVTESAYTENAEQLIRVIQQLREKGYVIEMDDFGSGYSSLNMLSSLPLDVLKMDIGFIRNIEKNESDFHLVELVLDIARYLKVPVVAEGVETEKQLTLLRDARCDLIQGYYFSKPLPAKEFERTILAPAMK